MISCWYATSFGEYTDGLRGALERKLGSEVGVISSNCGCGDSMEIKGQFQDHRCEFFRFPHVYYFKSSNPVKYWLRTKAFRFMYRERAKRYLHHADDAEILHFHQVLNAFGSAAVFSWLKLPAHAARVVTVHELDQYQLDCVDSNLAYNLADRIIVHASDLRQKLLDMGVDGTRIDLVEHGIELGPPATGVKHGIIFYGGHTIYRGKGLDNLFQAMATIRNKLGDDTPHLVIHGHYGDVAPESTLKLVEQFDLTGLVHWRHQIGVKETADAYREAMLCVLPYTGSFGGWPAVNALSYGATVIATKCAGLPDHLGDAAQWIPQNDTSALAEAILNLLSDEPTRKTLSTRGRARAEAMFGWDTIAAKTIESYRAALAHKAALSRK